MGTSQDNSINASFDVVGREIKIDKRNAKLYFIDGFCKDEIMVKIMAYFMKAEEKVIHYKNHLIQDDYGQQQ